MKLFDLQAAIAGAPIQFTSGEKLLFVAYVQDASFDDRFVFLNAAGQICTAREDNLYIFMSPIVKTYWYNVCKNKFGMPCLGNPFEYEYNAIEFSKIADGFIKTISIEFET
jgi:hypothetical protein